VAPHPGDLTRICSGYYHSSDSSLLILPQDLPGPTPVEQGCRPRILREVSWTAANNSEAIFS
jgi:hypothetical protein